MSHEISVRKNGFAEMAFAGATPWHGLGNRVDVNASVDVWRQQAGLDWAVKSAPVQFHADSEIRSFKEKVVLYRSDTNTPLSVVGDNYKVVQPTEVLEFFRDLTEAHGFKIHTAGVLQGGRKIWALARNGHVEEAAPGDKLRGNLLLATSCDGTMATQGVWTAVRVVCANTLRIAVDGATNAIKTSHRSVFDADETKRELGALDDSFAKFAAQAQELARKPISPITAREVLNQLFVGTGKNRPQPAAVVDHAAIGKSILDSMMERTEVVADLLAAKEHRAVSKVMHLFNGNGIGAQHAGSAGTGWGLVNAVSEYVDHHAGRSADSRINAAWFGNGAATKDRAIELVKAA